MNPRFVTVTPIKTTRNARASTVSCWLKRSSQRRAVRAGPEVPGNTRPVPFCDVIFGAIALRFLFSRLGRGLIFPIRFLPNRGAQNGFFRSVSPCELRHQIAFLHDADPVADPQDFWKIT